MLDALQMNYFYNSLNYEYYKLIEVINLLTRMSQRNSVDSTGTLFFTKYADPNLRKCYHK